MSKEKIVTDLDTLKQLVGSDPHNLKRILITALFANIALIVTGITTMVNDHYTIKNLVAFSIESKQIISEVNKKVSDLATSDANQNYRIDKIEERKK